jgi:hypothetical protein
MACGLAKYKKETCTHYVGRTGNEYPIDEYLNWGRGEKEKDKKDLPLDEYPYSFKYKVEFVYKCCELCSCSVKE